MMKKSKMLLRGLDNIEGIDSSHLSESLFFVFCFVCFFLFVFLLQLNLYK